MTEPAHALCPRPAERERSGQAPAQPPEPRFGLLELTLDRLHQALYLLDEEGRILYASAEACRSLGYAPAELAGVSLGHLDPESPGDPWPVQARQLAVGDLLTLPALHRRRDGTTFPVEIALSHLCFQGEAYRIAVVQEVSERRAAEEKLRADAESFRALAENSPQIIVRYDRECRRVYTNPALQRLAGKREPREFLGKRPTESGPVLSQPPVYEAKIRQVLATGEPQELLFHVQGAHGEFWHQALFVPERDGRGRVSSVLGVGHDVTPLLRAQQELCHRNRELRAISKCNQALARAEEERILLHDVCRIICEDAGYRMAWVGYAEHDADRTLRPIARAGFETNDIAEAGLSWSAETPAGIAIRTGEPVPVQEIDSAHRMEPWRAAALENGHRSALALPLADGGEVFGVLMVYAAESHALVPEEIRLLQELSRDIAFGVVALRNRERRRLAEQALRESEQKFRAIFVNSPLGLFRLGFDGRFLEMNPAFAAMFGYESTAAMMAGAGDLGATFSAAMLSRTTSVADLLAGPDTTRHHSRLRRRDGSEFTANLLLKTIRDGQGNPMFLEGILEDTTERKRAEERLRLLDFAVNNVRDEVYLLTEQAAIRYANEEASRALGYDREELLRMTVPDVDPDFTPERWREHWLDLKSHGALTFIGHHRGRDQRVYPVEISANYFEYDGEGYNVALVRDISEQHRTELALRRLNRALKTLSSGNEALVRAENEQELLEEMCRVVVDVGGYRFAWIGFAGPDGSVVVRAWAGHEEGFLAVRQSFCAEDPVCEALRSRQPTVTRSFDAPAVSAAFRTELQRRGFHACTAFPLLDDQTPGVLAIYAAEQGAFDTDEVQLLTEMSGDLAYGIRALRLRIEREQSVAQLRASVLSTIEALSNTVELRDPYTAGHQRRVARLATEVGRRLKWPEDRIQAIFLAGMVHDIGKIAVPAEILSKPGRLTEAEMMLIRAHADAGFEILKSVDFPWPIAEFIRQHHERLDGSGYPRGLKGDEIRLEARVLAVCDVVEAMTTHRPYRAGVGVDAALQEIERGKGTLFDPVIVEICADLLRRRDGTLILLPEPLHAASGDRRDLATPLP